ncbi:MAG: hypothetical protein E6J41_08230 [Chloroflexi bacterium]|nr:MAG: hypothetical protein E6J41_08230 [Chloroflexota bacterium]
MVERFLAGRSPNTRQAYADDLADFAAWLGRAPAAAVAQLLGAGAGVANALAFDYLNHLRDLGRSRATTWPPSARWSSWPGCSAWSRGRSRYGARS